MLKTILFIITISCKQTQNEGLKNPNEWRSIEKLAENHPYIVALLNGTKDYTCTGTIISKKAVLTSGSCVNLQPIYIAVATAIICKEIKNNNLFKVKHIELHGDYFYEFKKSEPSVTKIHSNLGLVFSTKPVSQFHIIPADISNYYAPQLKEKKLRAIGFGKISDSSLVALQKQAYYQMPCTNPKWFYCVCGMENSSLVHTYTHEFGHGAPVLLGDQVVGITASPCGVLSINSIKYNIFTVIGPYLQWIQKASIKPETHFRSTNSCDKEEKYIFQTCILLFFSSGYII